MFSPGELFVRVIATTLILGSLVKSLEFLMLYVKSIECIRKVFATKSKLLIIIGTQCGGIFFSAVLTLNEQKIK
jgi:hypothetical protein